MPFGSPLAKLSGACSTQAQGIGGCFSFRRGWWVVGIGRRKFGADRFPFKIWYFFIPSLERRNLEENSKHTEFCSAIREVRFQTQGDGARNRTVFPLASAGPSLLPTAPTVARPGTAARRRRRRPLRSGGS